MRGVVIIDWDEKGATAEWLTYHASGSGVEVDARDVPTALRDLADAIIEREEYRASIPD